MAAERILIIDDDEDVRDFLCQALQDEGYEVATAADGLSALELLGQVQPDLILLDALMPMMDGWISWSRAAITRSRRASPSSPCRPSATPPSPYNVSAPMTTWRSRSSWRNCWR